MNEDPKLRVLLPWETQQHQAATRSHAQAEDALQKGGESLNVFGEDVSLSPALLSYRDRLLCSRTV